MNTCSRLTQPLLDFKHLWIWRSLRVFLGLFVPVKRIQGFNLELRFEIQTIRSEWLENGAEKPQFAVAFKIRRSEIVWERLTFAATIRARFVNGARWKRSAWRIRVKTNAVTCLHRMQTKSLRSEISKFECFSFKFLCSAWNILGLYEC
jgi:hypothetical protein